MKMPATCQELIEKLNTAGYEAYIVGGCVRDMLLGNKPSDWDICTNATPDEMLSVFGSYRVIPTGLAHGTLTILVGDDSYEVTTYRIDGEYKDHRRPSEVLYTSDLKQDLSRRDFTINAMAYHPNTGLIDHFNGQSDLRKRLLRAVGDPLVRFEEDALRLLRLVRFATVLSFDYEAKTLESVSKKIHLLRHIAKERIQVELNKILLSDYVARGLTDLGELGFYPYIAQEICHQHGFTQGNNHFLDVMEHSFLATSLIEPDLTLRMTMFLHDIGKPFTYEDDEHYDAHEVFGSKKANKILRALKYDNFTRKEVAKLILHHNDQLTLDEVSIRKVLRAIGLDSTKRLIKVKVADILAHRMSYEKRMDVIAYFSKIDALVDKVIEQGDPYEIKSLALNGNDLKALGFEGKAIRDILEKLLDEVIEHPKNNTKEALLHFLSKKPM